MDRSAFGRYRRITAQTFAIVQALGAGWIAFGAGATVVAEAAGKAGVAPALADYLGMLVPLILGIIFFCILWQLSRSPSTIADPDKFDLRISTREQMKGREEDIRDLLEILDSVSQLLLVGESGSGKSTLIEIGLIPELGRTARLYPLLIRRYGSSWEEGLIKELLWTIKHDRASTKSPEDRASDPLTRASEIAELEELLLDTDAQARRTPVLIFDQFDDYQHLHRGRFTTADGAWITPSQLTHENQFWRMIGRLLGDRRIKCLFVTRADAAAGLDSMRFVESDEIRTRELLRLKPEFIPPILEGLAPSNANPPVVRSPMEGWAQLKPLIASDLESSGTFLPQHLRTVVLGLRTLPSLTPSAYRRAGGAEGVEAKYLSRALHESGIRSGLGPESVRRMLIALVSGVAEDSPELKALTRPMEVLLPSEDKERIHLALQELARREVVRPVWNAESATEEWRLDHDYLVRAVIHEARLQDRPSAILREAAAKWRSARGDWRSQWRSMLPLTTQLSLAWQRINKRSSFRYGENARFAAISMLRGSVVLLFAVVVGLGVAGWRLSGELSRMARSLAGNDAEIQSALVQLWNEASYVRFAVTLRNAGSDEFLSPGWVRAVAGLSTRESGYLARKLIALRTEENGRRIDTQLLILLPTLEKQDATLVVDAIIERVDNDLGNLSVDDEIRNIEPWIHLASPNAISRLQQRISQGFKTAVEKVTSAEDDLFHASRACDAVSAMQATFDRATAAEVLSTLRRAMEGESWRNFEYRCPLLFARAIQTIGPTDKEAASAISLLRQYADRALSDNENTYMEFGSWSLEALKLLDAPTANALSRRHLDQQRAAYVKDCLGKEDACSLRKDAHNLAKYAQYLGYFARSLSAKDASELVEDLVKLYREDRNRAAPEDPSYQVIEALEGSVRSLERQQVSDLLYALRSSPGEAGLLNPDSTGWLLFQSNGAKMLDLLEAMAPSLASPDCVAILNEFNLAGMLWSASYQELILALSKRLSAEPAAMAADMAMAALIREPLGDESRSADVRASQMNFLSNTIWASPPKMQQHVADLVLASLRGEPKSNAIFRGKFAWNVLGSACVKLAEIETTQKRGIECALIAASWPGGDFPQASLARVAGLNEAAGFPALLKWVTSKLASDVESLRPNNLAYN